MSIEILYVGNGCLGKHPFLCGFPGMFLSSGLPTCPFSNSCFALRARLFSKDGKDGYQFGDFTKGLLRLSHERGRHILGTYDDTGGAAKAAAVGSVSGVCSYAYQTSAVSSTLGAALGGTVGAPLGMVGVSAGMAAGSTAARRVSQGVSQCGTKVQKMVSSAVAEGKTARGDAEGQYRLGDFTSGVLAAGREARGANEGSRGYKPGDFTRGLFSKLRK